MINLFAYYEQHIFTILIIHFIISVVLAFLISIYALKRFQKSTKEIDEKDEQRLKSIKNKNWFFKALYYASLHKNNQIALFAFSFLFNLSIPFLGYFFSIWIFWYMLNVKYDEKIMNTNVLDLDEFNESFLKVERLFGEGSMINMMNNEYIPKSKKLKALSTLASNNSPMSLQIVKQTLSSSDDEIRMFGYAIINKAEKNINLKIDNNLSVIAKEIAKGDKKDTETIAFASKELAYLYWEMVYTELSHENLKINFLNSVISYLEIAKDFYLPQLENIVKQIEEYEKHDKVLENLKLIKKERHKLEDSYAICASLFSLMGRVYMHKHQYERAKAELTIAKELLSTRSTFLIPYLAELYFVTKKYNIVSSLLKQTQDLKYNAKLYPIIMQWEKA